jgi:hypothetical protein
MKNVVKTVLLLIFTIPFANAEESDPSLPCFLELKDKQELQILKDKISLSDGRYQTLEMLSNPQKPTKQEKKSLQIWVDAIENCKLLGDQWRKKNYPISVNNILEQTSTQLKLLTADLYAGKISYGVFAKERAVKLAKLNNDLTEVVQKIQAEIKAKQEQQAAVDEHRQQESASRQAADDEQRRNLAMQYLLNQPPAIRFTPQVPYQIPIRRTTNTNCSVNGNQMNCTTQ